MTTSTAPGILVAARYIAYACQGPTSVIIYVHDTQAPATDLWEHRYPGQFEMLDLTSLGDFDTRLGTSHTRLIAHGWDPMPAAIQDPSRRNGWREGTYAWSMPVEPTDQIRRVRDVAGRIVARGPMSEATYTILSNTARRPLGTGPVGAR